MTSLCVVLPFATPSQNVYQRMHYHAQNKLKKECMQWVRVTLNRAGRFGVNPPDVRMRVVVQRYSANKVDRGNLVGGCKPLLDALKIEGVIRDDTEQWIDDHYEQHPAPRKEGRTVVVVEEMPHGVTDAA